MVSDGGVTLVAVLFRCLCQAREDTMVEVGATSHIEGTNGDDAWSTSKEISKMYVLH